MATVSVIVFVPWGVVSKAFPPPAPGLGLERCILGHGLAIQDGKANVAPGQTVTMFSVCCPFRLVSCMLFEE